LPLLGTVKTSVTFCHSPVDATGEWQKVTLVFTVPNKGKWSKSDHVLVTLGAGGTPDCTTLFDDFSMEEK